MIVAYEFVLTNSTHEAREQRLECCFSLIS